MHGGCCVGHVVLPPPVCDASDRSLTVDHGLCRGLDAFGRRWHDYEIRGDGHIPRDRPSLVVMYHGFMPLDGWYFIARMMLEHQVWMRSLTDRFLLRTPGLARLVAAGGAIAGEPDAAYRLLQEGHTVLVSPGGVREAIAGKSWHYRVHWQQRLGFARLALRAQVPLIPIFGENVEELYRAPFCDRRPFQAFFEATRVPIVPVVGLGGMPFPVKLRTWVGEPVVPRPEDTPETLKERTRQALQALIDQHQAPRPRLPRALWQRISGA